MSLAPRLPLVLGTGLNGLVGSRVVKVLSPHFRFRNLDLADPDTPIDITNFSDVERAVTQSPAQFLLHCAAYTDVNKAWEQRDDKTGLAYQVNVIGTQNIAQAAAVSGKHLIHLSTAYVFDGRQPQPYTEEQALSPIEWYGQTKAWAEEAVQAAGGSWTILRIDQPFRPDYFPKLDIVHRVLQGLTAGTLPPQFTNHWIGPTYIDDLAEVIAWVLRSKTTGIFHATAGEQWTDFALATAVNQTFSLGAAVQPGDLAAYLAKSQRPYQQNTALATTKLRQHCPHRGRTIQQALTEMCGLSANQ